MKRFGFIIMSVALVLGMAQCKKNVETMSDGIGNQSFDGSIIRLKVNDGGKLAVFPATGAVYYTEGDVIHVASGGVYKGTLTYHDGYFTNFVGTAPSDGATMYFYYLGGKTPTEAIGDGTLTVNISDQTTGYPVISYGASNETYSTSNANYTATLKNVGALVKFDVTSSSVTVPTLIKGMNNQVSFTLSDNTIEYSKVDDGIIKLPAGSGERWAVLLPQSAVGYVGYSLSSSGLLHGMTVFQGDIPAIKENDYISSGIGVSVATKGYFTVNASGTQVWFANGNVEHIDDSTYFASTQWTDHSGDGTYDKYYFNSTQTNNAVTSLNSDNYLGRNDWRMLTMSEWKYLFNNRTTVDGTAGREHNWKIVIVSDVIQVRTGAAMGGAIIFPDEYGSANVSAVASTVTSTQLATLEEAGCVFLPFEGLSSDGSVSGSVGSFGYYRTPDGTSSVFINDTPTVSTNHNGSDTRGYSIRVVVNAE